MRQVTLDYSTLEAYISKIKYDRNNRFQILNPNTLKVLQEYGGDITLQITYICKKMLRSIVLFTPVLP